MRAALIYLFLCLAVLFPAYGAVQFYVPVKDAGYRLEVQVREGMTFREAVEAFREAGLLRDPVPVIALGRAAGIDRKLAFGYYAFSEKVSPWQVYEALRDRRIIRSQITIVEGDSLYEIRGKLAGAGLVNAVEFNGLSADPEFMEEYSIYAPSLEGYLFPDTYFFPKGMEPGRILGIMIDRLRTAYASALRDKAANMSFDERQVLTLASIIEKEARYDSERPLISAVYHNRLKKGMKLQADPTATYGLKPLSWGVTAKDIRKETDYNTYFIKGLPPGPIASPGLKSIEAALNPAKEDYLFFVSNNDGTHNFSETYFEHRQAIENYKEKIRSAETLGM